MGNTAAIAKTPAFYVDKNLPPLYIRLGEVPDPAFKPLKKGQLLIEVRSCGLNSTEGNLGRLPKFVLNHVFHGVVFGMETSGIVLKSRSKHFQPGDAVYGVDLMNGGGMCKHIILHERSVAHKPKNLTFNQTASLPSVFLTAKFGLDKAKLRKGQKILIIGISGGVGMAALILARHMVGPEGIVAGVCGTDNIASLETTGLVTPGLLLDYRKPEQLIGEDSPLRNHSFDVLFDPITSPLHPRLHFQGQRYDVALKFCLNPNTGWVVLAGGMHELAPKFMMGLAPKRYAFCNMMRHGYNRSEMEELNALWEKEAITPFPFITTYQFTEESFKEAIEIHHNFKAKGRLVVDLKDGNKLE